MAKRASAWSKVRDLFSGDSNEVLFELLEQANPDASLAEKMDWFEKILRWVIQDSASPYARLRFLHKSLIAPTPRSENFRKVCATILRECSFFRVFALTGFGDGNGFFGELAGRVLSRFLPAGGRRDILEMLLNVIEDEAEAAWFENIPEELVRDWTLFFAETLRDEDKKFVLQEAKRALLLLAVNVAYQGTSEQVRTRTPDPEGAASPFQDLQFLAARMYRPDGEHPENPELLGARVLECHRCVEWIHREMENSGVSVQLEYRLELIDASLARIEELALLVGNRLITGSLLSSLALAVVNHRNVGRFFQHHLHLISRKIVERNGFSGEHYVTESSAKERWKLFLASVGGGMIVVLMTILKINAMKLAMPPLIQATIIWMIYTGGFLAMQFSGFVLATKLPSFTASYLARLLSQGKGTSRVLHLVGEFRSMLKTQTIAFIGNLSGLAPLVLAGHFLHLALFDRPPMTILDAELTLWELHPFLSMAVFLGALTGVLLWISSLAGGWFENFVVFQKIPGALLRNRRFVRAVGPESAEYVRKWILKHSSGIAANVALGFLFGFTPFLGHLVGVHLESKHVTISTTQAAFAALAEKHWDGTGILIGWAIAGLFLIGAMNLLVSFFIAFIVAARASTMTDRKFRALVALVGRNLLRRTPR